uniref:glycoside hydrolase family 68 protein n=1 Tax=Altererythrobacter segetis TaxID=1104773 RepID=UPI001FAF0022|nr:glycoside hydrolase family 68 protein [Altererythrobacter segetis]
MSDTEISIPGRRSDFETPSRWTAAHVAGIAAQKVNHAPVIDALAAKPVSSLGLWDAWPVQRADGRPALLDGGDTLWMALAAPRFADPDERHSHARIYLLLRNAQGWTMLGPAMPEGFSPGSREWSGSAILDPATGAVTVYFTSAGRRNERLVSYEQRIFEANAHLGRDDAGYRLNEWSGLREIIEPDPAFYMATNRGGAPGTIKAFRDPFPFLDPANGTWTMVFAGSAAGSSSPYNGVIGAASAVDEQRSAWRLLPPILSADGLNNELERPHIVHHAGLYYLFWSTQDQVFDPAGPIGPTGLYGMVSPQLCEQWEPLNGTGLVFCNPPEAPRQAYGWLVLPDRSVISFVDDWRGGTQPEGRRFGGTFAPTLRLALNGSRAQLVGG